MSLILPFALIGLLVGHIAGTCGGSFPMISAPWSFPPHLVCVATLGAGGVVTGAVVTWAARATGRMRWWALPVGAMFAAVSMGLVGSYIDGQKEMMPLRYGVGVALALLPVVGLVAAARRFSSARGGSLLDGANRRGVWVATCGLAALLAAIGRVLGVDTVYLLVSVLVSLGALVLSCLADAIALRRIGAFESMPLSSTAVASGPASAVVDLGVGDDTRANLHEAHAGYRGSAFAASRVVLGSAGDARARVHRQLVVGLATLALSVVSVTAAYAAAYATESRRTVAATSDEGVEDFEEGKDWYVDVRPISRCSPNSDCEVRVRVRGKDDAEIVAVYNPGYRMAYTSVEAPSSNEAATRRISIRSIPQPSGYPVGGSPSKFTPVRFSAPLPGIVRVDVWQDFEVCRRPGSCQSVKSRVRIDVPIRNQPEG